MKYLTPANRANAGFPDIIGLHVRSVEKKGLAADLGIRPRHVVLAVGDRKTTSRIELEIGILNALSRSEEILLKVYVLEVGDVTHPIPLDWREVCEDVSKSAA